MKCNDCDHLLPPPTIEEQIAYYVCDQCGNCQTEDASELSKTTSDLIAEFESQSSLSLPDSYKSFLLNSEDSKFINKSISITGEVPKDLKHFLDNGTISINKIFGVSKEESSIFDNNYLIEEWELPSNLLLLDGDGHAWLALDYRENTKEPPVIFIESEFNQYIIVAETFELLIKNSY